MKVRILQGVRVLDRAAEPGDIVDISDFDAAYLVGGGRAEKYVEPPKPVVDEVTVAAPKPVVVLQGKPVTAVVDTAKKSNITEK